MGFKLIYKKKRNKKKQLPTEAEHTSITCIFFPRENIGYNLKYNCLIFFSSPTE